MNKVLLDQVLSFIGPLIHGAFGDSVPAYAAALLMAHAMELAAVGADLLDGDAHLSVDTRNSLSALVLEIKARKG